MMKEFSGEDLLKIKSRSPLTRSVNEIKNPSLHKIKSVCRRRNSKRDAFTSPIRPRGKLRIIGELLKKAFQLVCVSFVLLLLYIVFINGCVLYAQEFLEDVWFEIKEEAVTLLAILERKILDLICATGLSFSLHLQGVLKDMGICLFVLADCLIALFKFACLSVEKLRDFLYG